MSFSGRVLTFIDGVDIPSWFLLPEEHLFMNGSRYLEDMANYTNIETLKTFRYGIMNLNEHTFENFLLNSNNCRIDVSDLKNEVIDNINNNESSDYLIPSHYVQVKNRCMYGPSCSLSLIKYVYPGWILKREEFLHLIDFQYRFWIIDNVNVFSEY